MSRLSYLLTLILGILFTSCGSYFNQPVKVQQARLGESTTFTDSLLNLPPPVKKVEASVYRFRDQSGQYKPTETGSTFSTAVTQGATSILIKAMEDSGWFIPLERENFGNLNTERQIILSTRQREQQKNPNVPQPELPPLLFSGILLEGGIISYDANIITGGFGARYFGAGASTQYRQDRVTVYLRAVSTSTGRVLKTVYTSKTILSQALDGGFFRFVKLRRLLEAETGYTHNEPSQLAVTEAIEKAVEALIVEGIQDGLWPAQGSDSDVQKVLDKYNKEKEIAADTKLYDRFFTERRTNNAFKIDGGASMYDGDFANSDINPRVDIAFDQAISDAFRVRANIGLSQLSVENGFQRDFNDATIEGVFNILPYEQLTPYVLGGLGYYLENENFGFDFSGGSFFKANYGAGMEYLSTPKLGIMGEVKHNLVFSDEVDGFINGRRDDHYFSLGIGANFYLGKMSSEKTTTTPLPKN